MKTRSNSVTFAGIATALLFTCLSADAQTFPAQGTDTTTSLGQFTIVVNPAYIPAASAIAGAGLGFTYDAGKNLLTSPLLFDPTTTIDRSSATTVGSTAYNTGLAVGTPANGTVKAGDITMLPSGYVPAAGARTVFTQINSFTLANGGTSVTAGSAAANQPRSVGEVVSNATGAGLGNPANDFPARSFFDVFVDVNVPGVGTPLVNTTPLLINNNAITGFPPTVIYTHGNSSAVPLEFTAGNTVGAPTGDVFGVITLAGHGAGYTPGTSGTGTDATAFENTYNSELNNPTDLMPLPQADASWSTYVPVAMPEPSAAVFGIFCIGAAVMRRTRRTQSARIA